jgi:hypothetical protein
MLFGVAADYASVAHRLLVTVSLVCCTLVCVSFALFARDQVAGASKHQQNELVSTAPASTGTPVAVHHTGQPRAFIDSAAHTLTSPFTSLVHSNNDWVTHGFPAAVALLVYGLGLGFLARFAQEKA